MFQFVKQGHKFLEVYDWEISDLNVATGESVIDLTNPAVCDGGFKVGEKSNRQRGGLNSVELNYASDALVKCTDSVVNSVSSKSAGEKALQT